MKSRLILLALMLAGVAAFILLGGPEYFTLSAIKAEQAQLALWLVQNPITTFTAFFAVYVVFTALSLPAATLMTVLAGGLFGFVWGLVLVSFASTLGATLAMLAARYILRDGLQQRYAAALKKVNDGFKQEGAFYLFSLRLVPAFPFFLVNLVMGLLPISTRTYWWVSQLGMLPGTAVYVYAGTALASINSLSDIVSPPLLLAFTLLGVLPLLTKKILTHLRKPA